MSRAGHVVAIRKVRSWHEPEVGGRAEHACSAQVFQTSTCSAIAKASSTSMSRYLIASFRARTTVSDSPQSTDIFRILGVSPRCQTGGRWSRRKCVVVCSEEGLPRSRCRRVRSAMTAAACSRARTCPTGNFRMRAMHKVPVVPICRRYLRLLRRANHNDALAHPASVKRDVSADRHDTWGGDAVDAVGT